MSFNFAASQPAQSQGSLFGGGAPQSQSSLFGQQQQPNTQSQSLFGGAALPLQTQSSLFGGIQQPQSQGSLFGAQQQQPQQQLTTFQSTQSAHATQFNSFFNVTQQSAPSLFSNQQQQQPQQPQQQQQQQQQLPASLLQIIDRLNPMHPSSPFQAALYNVVQPDVVSQYTKPQAMHSVLWHAAQSVNPDPSRQVPVHANGFDDLILRAQTQSSRVDDHKAVLSKLSSNVSDIQKDVNSQLGTKLAAYRRRHRELARKLLRIAAAVDIAVNNDLLTTAESNRRKRIQAIAKALTAPGEFKDKLCDLVEVASVSNDNNNNLSLQQKPSTLPVTIRDKRAADAIRDLLSDQLKGIEQLGLVCTKIDRDLSIMKQSVNTR